MTTQITRRADGKKVSLKGRSGERWLRINAMKRDHMDINNECWRAFYAATQR